MPQPMPRQPLIFPVKGLHEGVGYDFQPEGTTPDALNVRGYDPIKNRLRGGRRAGLDKYFPSQINGNNVIQAMAKTVEGTAYTSQNPDNQPTTIVDEDFSTYVIAIPTYLGENWVYKDAPATGLGVGDSLLASSHWGISANGLVLDGAYASSAANLRHLLIPCRFEGPNDSTVTMQARTQATTANSSTGASNDCQCMGPFIRADAACCTYVYACLIRQAANDSVQLQIIHKGSVSTTILVQSANISLLNNATITNNMTIALFEDFATNLITAQLIWPGGGAAGVDLNVTITTTNTSNNFGYRRQGLGVYGLANLALIAGTSYRTFKRIQTSFFQESLPLLAYSITSIDHGNNQYYIPAGYTACNLNDTGSGTLTTQIGPYDSNTTPAGANFRIDTIAKVFNNGQATGSPGIYKFIMKNDPISGGGPFNVEATLKSAISAGAPGILFCHRFDAGFNNGLIAVVSNATPTATYVITGCLEVLNLRIFRIANHDTNAVILNTSYRMPVHKNSKIRCEDDGVKLTFYVDNVLVDISQTVSDYPSNTYTGLGTDDLGATTPSIISTLSWRQRSANGSSLPLGSTSSATLLTISGGTVIGIKDGAANTAINGTGVMTTEPFQIQMQSAYNRTFMVDGTRSKVYNLQNNTVEDWIADPPGALPDRCRLICLYRGRLTLSGKVDDPHNYFMSAVGEPNNWDYDPAVPNAIQAVAGNNSDAGLVGDIITALIPFSDDILIFGGDHTIYAMTGDPAAGGTVDMISDQTGIAFGKAWAKDPNGMLYFWGQDGIYRMIPGAGSKPENISKMAIDVRLRRVDLNFNRIYMEWDYLRASLMTLIVPVNINTPTRLIVWESRSDAWWEDQYPTSQGPHIMFPYDSADADDQTFLFGGRDGYIREIDETANSDDGVAITSRVRFAPFIAPDHGSEVILNSVLPILADGSGEMYLDVYTGQSAEDCVLATNPRVHRLLTHSGRNASVRQKVRGYAVQLGLLQTGISRWALEGLTVTFENSGLPRREVRPRGD